MEESTGENFAPQPRAKPNVDLFVPAVKRFEKQFKIDPHSASLDGNLRYYQRMSVEQTNTTGEALLRLPDAAKYLGISKDRLRGMVRGDNGSNIACYRLSPRDIRFSKRDLDAWLESCRLS